jgi:hypothetical protein
LVGDDENVFKYFTKEAVKTVHNPLAAYRDECLFFSRKPGILAPGKYDAAARG